jgi:hypothetical protein
MRIRLLLCTAIAALAVAAPACGDDDASPTSAPASAPTAANTRAVTVQDGTHSAKLTIELASTQAQRERGLMERPSLADDAAMLFIFPAEARGGFWMKNTLIPLDIAYLDGSGRVLEIKHGKPLDETVLTPKQPYRYTLEVAGGWFERHQMGPGATLSLPTDLPTAQ